MTHKNSPRSPEDLEIIGLSSTMYGLEPSTMLLLDIILLRSSTLILLLYAADCYCCSAVRLSNDYQAIVVGHHFLAFLIFDRPDDFLHHTLSHRWEKLYHISHKE